MGWFKTDDRLTFHRKTVLAGNAAMGAWVRIGAWVGGYETDGFIPGEVVDLIANEAQRERLVFVGFLIRHPDGRYEMHDYLKYNPSHAQLEEQRARWAKHKRLSRASSEESEAESEAESTVDSTETDTVVSGLGMFVSETSTETTGQLATAASNEVTGIRARDTVADDVLAVLEHWADKLYAGRRVKFDDKRKKRIRARLSEGFGVADLKLAIDGALRDDWLMGRKDGSPKDGYRDVSTVLRDAAQVERLMALTKDGAAALAKRPRTDVQAMGEGAVAVKTEDSSSGPLGAVTPIGVRVEKRRAPTTEERALLEGIVGKIGNGGQR